MLIIEPLSRLKPRYAVSDERGSGGTWERRRFGEEMTGDIDGEPYELTREKRKRLLLVQSGRTVASAEEAKRGSWTISAGDTVYDLRARSRMRPAMELRSDGTPIGSVEREGLWHRRTLCDLPDGMPPAVQAFVGFVALTLWHRAATSGAAAETVAATGS